MRRRILALAVLSIVQLAPMAHAEPKGCPPGLAKKNSHCLPPGLAKKRHHDAERAYRVGDRIERDHVVIYNPDRYDLDPRGTYWRIGDDVFQVDRDTGEILVILGAIARLLN